MNIITNVGFPIVACIFMYKQNLELQKSFELQPSFKINGKTLKDTNNNTRLFNISNGIINFNFNLPGKLKSGNHILSIVIPELRETLSLRMNYTMTII